MTWGDVAQTDIVLRLRTSNNTIMMVRIFMVRIRNQNIHDHNSLRACVLIE